MAERAVAPDIPPRLRKAGITGYSSNLEPGQQVVLPGHVLDLYVLLFGEETIKRLVETRDLKHNHESDTPSQEHGPA